ncbi:NAD kinase [Comamonas odontotermitis]|uniref:NAD kinase n=1 Tax=Comamonas TaxID=283 RepID=UPI001CC3AE32|nr:NAD kinase [Comamonas odontotermitis]UBB16447.1 NAD kinase [Comamonas odontotermitis]
MQSRFQHIALIGKYHAPPSAEVRQQSIVAFSQIASYVEARGGTAYLEQETANFTGMDHYPTLSLDEVGRRCDLAIVLGGDGTMLGVGRELAKYNTPLVGINQGRLGFVTDIPLQTFLAPLSAILAGEYEEEIRSMIHALVIRDGECVFQALAFNDVVVNRGGTSGMVELRVEVDGQLVANQRADGLIIATPTGSTAYALSVGGPIVHPALACWVMAPIAPHMLSNRPIVVPDTQEISIEVIGGRDVAANFDMQSLASILRGDKILVRSAPHKTRFLHPRGWNYYATLRKKLGWNEGGITP